MSFPQYWMDKFLEWWCHQTSSKPIIPLWSINNCNNKSRQRYTKVLPEHNTGVARTTYFVFSHVNILIDYNPILSNFGDIRPFQIREPTSSWWPSKVLNYNFIHVKHRDCHRIGIRKHFPLKEIILQLLSAA